MEINLREQVTFTKRAATDDTPAMLTADFRLMTRRLILRANAGVAGYERATHDDMLRELRAAIYPYKLRASVYRLLEVARQRCHPADAQEIIQLSGEIEKVLSAGL